MFETYQAEIMKKRRAARVFWLIVFVCSGFLYFFFQGYYPDVRVGFRRIFSESGSSLSGSTDLMRSFGIINVRTTQSDTVILLEGKIYGNNEKRMSDYGDYMMDIDKPGYIKHVFNFRIDREKPFFIEKISLLPISTYKKLNDILDIYPIDAQNTLMKTASGIIWSGSLIDETNSLTGTLYHIGGKYFRVDTNLLSWEGDKFKKTRQDIKNFIETCQNIQWTSNLFYCPKSQSLLTEGGTYMTGVLDIRDNLIKKNTSIIEIKNGIPGKIWKQNEAIDLINIVILNNIFFIKKSGTLTPIDPRENPITSPLDTIDKALSMGDDIMLLGKKEGQIHLIIRHPSDPIDREKDIILPANLSYQDIKFHSLDGNHMIQTQNGILFVYRSGNIAHWIVQGEIVLYKDTGAIYKKNGEFWETDWSEKI